MSKQTRQKRTVYKAPVNNDEYPFANLSVTIGNTGGNIPMQWWQHVVEFQTQFVEKAATALERGKRNGHLHIQAVWQTRIPLGVSGISFLKRELKKFINPPNDDEDIQLRMEVKRLNEKGGQTFEEMLSYVTKDREAADYQVSLKGVTQADIDAAYARYVIHKTDWTEGKEIISRSNFLKLSNAFYHYYLYPIRRPEVSELLWLMIQSGRYTISGNFLTAGYNKALDAQRIYLGWKIISDYRSVTREDVVKLFFENGTLEYSWYLQLARQSHGSYQDIMDYCMNIRRERHMPIPEELTRHFTPTDDITDNYPYVFAPLMNVVIEAHEHDRGGEEMVNENRRQLLEIGGRLFGDVQEESGDEDEESGE